MGITFISTTAMLRIALIALALTATAVHGERKGRFLATSTTTTITSYTSTATSTITTTPSCYSTAAGATACRRKRQLPIQQEPVIFREGRQVTADQLLVPSSVVPKGLEAIEKEDLSVVVEDTAGLDPEEKFFGNIIPQVTFRDTSTVSAISTSLTTTAATTTVTVAISGDCY